ncbi:MAG: Gfo/Idh/MocA family protein [Erysipelotrichaceae bacterium]|jgi:predicted dehydrogenase
MINIAVIGLGNISKRVIEGVKFVKDANLYCVASRNKEKAIEFKEKYDAEVAYNNYEDVYKDKNVDLVYICTANHLHYHQIMSCLENGKHVICEKPMVSSIKEINELFDLAKEKNLFLMEAEKTVFTDMHKELKKVIKKGIVGEVISITADYSYNISYLNFPKDHWAFDEKHGGCLRDVGVYPICFCNSIADSKIKNITGVKYVSAEYKCDFGGKGIIEYENGIKASIESCWFYDSFDRGYAVIFGTKGKIYVPNYWKGNKFRIVFDNNETKEIEVSQNSDFEGEIQEAVDMIKSGRIESPAMNREKTIEIMKVIEKLLNY